MDTAECQQHIFELERTGKEWQQLYDAFQEGLSNAPSLEAATSLFRTIIYAKLRYVRADSIGKESTDFSPVQELFEQGRDYCLKEYGKMWDSDGSFTKNYAYFAFYRLNDVELGRKLWKDVLGSGAAKLAKTWIEAANMERRFGTVEAARSLLYRGINSVYVDYTPLFDYFVQFERDEGNFEQIQKALRKVNDQMARIYENEENRKKEETQNTKVTPKAKGKKYQKPDTPFAVPSRKRPATFGLEQPIEVKNAKKQDDTEMDVEEESLKDKDGFTIPPLPIRVSPRSDASSPVEQQNFKYSTDIERNKLFVKNLPFKCTNDQLKDAFSVYGNVKDARIVMKKNGISKCCGYVDFENEADASKALVSSIEIGGRPIAAFISNPPSKSDKPEATNLHFQQPRTSKPALGSRTKPMAAASTGGRKMRIEGFVPRSVALSNSKPVKQ